MHKKLMIIGASGHGKVVADIAKKNGYEEIKFLDDDKNKKRNGIYEVVGTSEDIDKYLNDYDFFVGIGNNEVRKKISKLLTEKNIKQPILIHPNAVIDATVTIGEGTVIMANAVINADTKIAKHCIINTSSTVDHDCVLENYVHVAPGSHLSGNVHVGNLTWIGVGSTVINNITICDSCFLGAGAVVIKNIKDRGTYVGVPIRMVEK